MNTILLYYSYIYMLSSIYLNENIFFYSYTCKIIFKIIVTTTEILFISHDVIILKYK